MTPAGATCSADAEVAVTGATDALDPQLPEVTVVIPSRGSRGALLSRAVRSVLDNGYPGRVSVLLVADGTDVEVLREQAPEATSVRPNDRAPGLPGARNSGILAATGDIVAFCDDDDEWVPGKLLEQVRLLEQHADAVLVGCGITIVQEGRLVPRRTPSVVKYPDLLRDRVMSLHSSTLVMRRAALLERVGLLDEELPGGFGEDYDLLLRVARVADLLSVPEPYVRVHWHGSSYYFSHWATIASALSYLLAKHPDFSRTRRGQARLEAQIAIALAASGQRGHALRLAVHSFRRWPLEARAGMALVVAARPSTVELFQHAAHRAGRGL